jgi:methylated-DNA-[protein]-cysteine S-methyltransferase
MRIIYHVMSAPAPLGLLFMATSERGLRYLEFLDRRSLKRAIAAHAADNPGATWEPSVREMRPLADLLDQYFCGTVRYLKLPLDLAGSEFQLKVWNALREIPYGETRSYGDIARAIGDPKAARAVGLACNQNPVAIVVPCHRVIGADGKLVGYVGGVPRKKALLGLEGRFRDMLPLEGDRVIAPITVQVKRVVPSPKPASRAKRPAKAPARPARVIGVPAAHTKAVPVAARASASPRKLAAAAPARKRVR